MVPFHLFINQEIHEKYYKINMNKINNSNESINDIAVKSLNPCISSSIGSRGFNNYDLDILHAQTRILAHELGCIWKDLRNRLNFDDEMLQQIFCHKHIRKQVKKALKKNKKKKPGFSFVGNISKEMYRENYKIIKKILNYLDDWLCIHHYLVKLHLFQLWQLLFFNISKRFYNSIIEIDVVYETCKKIWNLYALYFPNDMSPYKIKILTQIYFRLKFIINDSWLKKHGFIINDFEIQLNGLVLGCCQGNESFNCLLKKHFNNYSKPGQWELNSKNVLLFIEIRSIGGIVYGKFSLKMDNYKKFQDVYVFYKKEDDSNYQIHKYNCKITNVVSIGSNNSNSSTAQLKMMWIEISENNHSKPDDLYQALSNDHELKKKIVPYYQKKLKERIEKWKQKNFFDEKENDNTEIIDIEEFEHVLPTENLVEVDVNQIETQINESNLNKESTSSNINSINGNNTNTNLNALNNSNNSINQHVNVNETSNSNVPIVISNGSLNVKQKKKVKKEKENQKKKKKFLEKKRNKMILILS